MSLKGGLLISSNIKIEKYNLKNNEIRYRFKIYLGTDELTGKPKGTTRSGFKSPKEAKMALAELRLEIDRDLYQPKLVETYRDIYDIWVEHYEHTVQDSTFLKTVRVFENHILPAMGNYRIKKINIEICQKQVNLWSTQLKRFKMVKNYAAKVINFAIKNGYLHKNPFEYVEIPVVKKRISLDDTDEDDNFYSREQLLKFLEALESEGDLKKHVFFRLLAYSGMRKSEALALTWRDIDFAEDTIRINKAVARGIEGIYLGPTKNGLSRTIKMDKDSMQLLKTWKKALVEEFLKRGIITNKIKQFIFPSSSNGLTDPNRTYGWMQKIQKKYHLPRITTHGLRHTHCSLLFEAGANVKEVQYRLGHRDVRITLEIYTHVTQKNKADTVEKFSNFLTS